jgi:hypothetical protein
MKEARGLVVDGNVYIDNVLLPYTVKVYTNYHVLLPSIMYQGGSFQAFRTGINQIGGL